MLALFELMQRTEMLKTSSQFILISELFWIFAGQVLNKWRQEKYALSK